MRGTHHREAAGGREREREREKGNRDAYRGSSRGRCGFGYVIFTRCKSYMNHRRKECPKGSSTTKGVTIRADD